MWSRPPIIETRALKRDLSPQHGPKAISEEDYDGVLSSLEVPADPNAQYTLTASGTTILSPLVVACAVCLGPGCPVVSLFLVFVSEFILKLTTQTQGMLVFNRAAGELRSNLSIVRALVQARADVNCQSHMLPCTAMVAECSVAEISEFCAAA